MIFCYGHPNTVSGLSISRKRFMEGGLRINFFSDLWYLEKGRVYSLCEAEYVLPLRKAYWRDDLDAQLVNNHHGVLRYVAVDTSQLMQPKFFDDLSPLEKLAEAADVRA